MFKVAAQPNLILIQINPMHTLVPYFFKPDRANYLLVYDCLPCGFLHSGFCDIWISHWPHSCCMPRPSYPHRFDHPNNTGWRVNLQIMKLLIILFSASSCYFCLGSKYSPQQPDLKHRHSVLFPEWLHFTAIKRNVSNCVLYILSFKFLFTEDVWLRCWRKKYLS
jgi:hypothetical protein